MTATARARTDAPIIALSIAREALAAALSRAALTTATRTTLPILSAAKITHSAEGLTFVTTDIDRTLTTTVATPDGPSLLGETVPVTLPAKRLLDIVSQLPPGAVTLEISAVGSGCRAKLSSGRSRFEVVGLSPDEFPAANPIKPSVRTTLDGRALAGALARALPHTSSEPSRPVLNGILFEATEQGLFLAGTDGFHLSQERLLDSTELRGQWILPKTAVGPIAKLFGECETIDFAAADTRVAFMAGGNTLDVRLIGGPYPNYRMFLGKQHTHEGVVDRAQLLTSVKRMRTLSDVKKVNLTWYAKELHVTAEHADTGRGEDVIACDCTPVDGSPLPADGYQLAYVPEILIDSLAAHDAEGVRFEMTSVAHPAYIRDAATREGRLLTLVVGLATPKGA